MKIRIIIFAIFLISISLSAQSFNGGWEGKVITADTTFDIEFFIVQNKGIVKGVLIKPEKFALSDSSFNGTELNLKSTVKGFTYNGSLTRNLNRMSGILHFKNRSIKVDLFRGDKELNRPQLPLKPFPYVTEDVVFTNKSDSTILSGTLTLPDSIGQYPAVILIGGSYPSTRDYETSDNHRRYLVLADYLTRKGVAVLRYDSRGIGKSTGDFFNSTSEDFANDIVSGINYLASRKDIDKRSIGLIGHSGGGVVATIVASQNSDVRFIVLLASPGIKVKDAFKRQTELQHQSGDLSDDKYNATRLIYEKCDELIKKDIDTKSIIDSIQILRTTKLKEYFADMDRLSELRFNGRIKEYASPHNRFDLQCDPSIYLEKIKCPVLSLNGSNDLNVSAKDNQSAIRIALNKANNKDFEIIEQEGLNHVFQECKTGSMKDIENLEQTISPKALTAISDWIDKQLNKY